MHSGFLLLGIVLSIPILANAANNRFTAVDSEGNKIVLSAPARRIVSLSPHITELLFAAGAGEYVIGVVDYSDYPAAAKQITRVGSALRVDMEALVSLKPDLVVAWTSGNSTADIAAIKRFGVPVFYSDPKRLEDIPRQLGSLAKLTATESMAARSSAIYNKKYKKLLNRRSSEARIPLFYQLWHQPLMTVNKNHLINDVIELCGGANVFASLATLTPAVGVEDVVAANPQVIVASNIGRRELISMWQKWSGLTAVDEERFVTIPADLIHRQGPRIIEAAELMCRGLATAAP